MSKFCAINAKQLEITFSQPVDESTVITGGGILQNITIDEIGTATAITAGAIAAELSEDDKTLTATADITQAAEIFKGQYTVTVDETQVTDVDGNAIAKYSEIKTFEDETRPSVVGVEYSSDGTDKIAIIEFTEPVDVSTANFEFTRKDGVALNAATDFESTAIAPLANSNHKKMVVVFDAVNPADENKDINVKITNLKDYAGKLITPNPANTTIKYDKTDQAGPEVTSIVVKDNKTLTIKFDKALQADPGATTFQIGSPAVNSASVTKIDALTYDVAWAADLPEGLQTVVIPAVKNINGEPAGATTTNKLVTITLDDQAPVFQSSKVEKIAGVEHLILTYDENVDPQNGVNVDLTYVEDYISKTATITTVTPAGPTQNFTHYNQVNGKSKSVKLDLSSLTASADYTAKLNVGLVEDLNGNDSEVKTGVTFTRTADTVSGKPPVTTFAQNVADNNVIDVTFDKKVDPVTALNKANYSVEGVTIKSVTLTANTASNATVELNLVEGSATFTGNRVVSVSGVKSEGGDVMNTYTDVKNIKENIVPTVTKAELTSTTEITLTFSEDVKGAGGLEVFVGNTKFTGKRSDDINEVLNYFEGLNKAQRLLKQIPISTRMFLKLHETILRDSRGKNRSPGSYRKVQNFIGPTNNIKDATYIPPEPTLINEYMSNLEEYINGKYKDDFGYISKAAIIHGQFETIHPFLDGNGRLGRILIIIYLLDNNIISYPSFFVSEELEKNKNKYYALLNNLRLEEPRWKDWIIFFLNLSIKQAEKYISKLVEIESLYNDMVKISNEKNIPEDAVLFMFNKPIFTTNKMKDELGVSYNTARRYVIEFSKQGKIYGDDKKRNRVYSFYDLLDIL